VRIVTGSLVQESNTFSPLTSDRSAFQSSVLAWDAASLTAMTGTRTELGGFIAASTRAAVTLVPTVAAWAPSGGPMVAEDFRWLTGQFLERIAAAGHVDGVLLALHGAWVSADEPDADGWLVSAVRSLVGPDTPIVVTLDLHANITARMVHAANLVVGYRTYPHTDMFETGVRAAELLFRIFREGIRPTMAVCKVPLLLPPENAQTHGGPLAPLVEDMRVVERLPGFLAASLFTVQPWLDVPELGSAVIVATDGAADNGGAAAQTQADRLAVSLWEMRHAVHVPLVSPHLAVAQALARPEGPILLIDSADSVSSGAPGDSTAILQALLDAQPARLALVTIVDPEIARDAAGKGNGGQHVHYMLGARLDPARHVPVAVSGTVEPVTSRQVRFMGGIGDGLTADIGAAAILTVGMVRILIMEKAVPCYDPALYRTAGLEPTEAQVVVVKSPNNFRHAYQDIARDWIYVDAPGASTPRLSALVFTQAPRPLYPLDDVPWHPVSHAERSTKEHGVAGT